MDTDIGAALAEITKGITTLATAMTLVARHQTIQGEQLAAIVRLLTPDEDGQESQGPSTQEILERMMEANALAAQTLTQHLKALGKAVAEVPAETVRVIGGSHGSLTRPPR